MAPVLDDFDFGVLAGSIKNTENRVIKIEATLEKWGSIPLKVRILWKYGWILATVILVATVKLVFKVPMPWAGG